MKILQIAPYIDPRLGGQERHVLGLSEAISRLGHDVTILTCGPYPSSIVKGFEVFKTSSHSFLGLRFIPVKQLYFFLRARRFDLCHLHHQTLFGETVLMTNKLLRLATVTTLHTQMHRRLPAKVFYDRMSLKSIGALSSKVICLSHNIMDDFVRRGLERSKCVVIPNALDVESLKERFDKSCEQLDEPRFDLLFVGRLEERKGIRWLLRSISLLHREGKKYTLRIVGHGPLTQEVQRIISANNLELYVKQLGYVSEERLLKCYISTRVVVIPSLYEGLPTVALEAMVARKPLIVSNIPGLNELIKNGRNGFAVKPMDTRELALAIGQILESRNAMSSLANVNNRILMRYDWHIVAKNIEKLYQEILECSN